MAEAVAANPPKPDYGLDAPVVVQAHVHPRRLGHRRRVC